MQNSLLRVQMVSIRARCERVAVCELIRVVNRLFWHCRLYFSPSNPVEDELKSASELLHWSVPFAAQYSLMLSETLAGHNPKSQEYELELEGYRCQDMAVNSGYPGKETASGAGTVAVLLGSPELILSSFW